MSGTADPRKLEHANIVPNFSLNVFLSAVPKMKSEPFQLLMSHIYIFQGLFVNDAAWL